VPNQQNLIPMDQRTESEARELSKLGGRASGAARRRKRALKEAADLYLSLPVSDKRRWNALARRGLDPEDVDNQMAMIVGLTDAAADGDARAGRLILDILGEGEFWLRPPYGITDAAARQWADSPIVLWSVDPEDWKDQDVGRIVAGVVEHVQDGDIILMHDLYGSSVDAAVQIVDALLGKGYCFVTVEDLLARNGIEAQDGVIYRSGRK